MMLDQGSMNLNHLQAPRDRVKVGQVTICNHTVSYTPITIAAPASKPQLQRQNRAAVSSSPPKIQ